ncbi:MAG: MarR family transcriptional regulator [Acidobacteria bacterium]|nr:MarR family transcriptional regulator [Acidobacteriota bacterium]
MASKNFSLVDTVSGDPVDRLRTTLARLGRQIRMSHVDENLSPTQIEVLAAVVRCGPLRLSTLAADEGINPTMLSRIVAKLESAHLVERTPDRDDARIIHVVATDAGRALLQEVRSERTSALRYGYSRLDSAQRASVEQALGALEAMAEILKNRNA